MNKLRMVIFPLVAALHVILIFFLVFTMNTITMEVEPVADVMKLVDVAEETPPPPPPPKEPPPPPVEQNTVEAIAVNMRAVDEVPPQVVVTAPIPVRPQEPEYLPANKISKRPELPDGEIRKRLVELYPPIALRSGVEGMVTLDLAIDAQGNITHIEILKEAPAGRGFGEAAVKALKGIVVKPAESNGRKVRTRYRYPLKFTIKR
jgi:protein TonB